SSRTSAATATAVSVREVENDKRSVFRLDELCDAGFIVAIPGASGQSFARMIPGVETEADAGKPGIRLTGRSAAGLHLRLQIILQADLADQFDLRFEVIDVLLGIFENFLEDFARHVVLTGLAVRDGFDQIRVSASFQLEVAGEAFGYVFADQQLVQLL